MGLAELPADAVSGPVTVFYPSQAVAGLALILGIDRFMSEARALTNLVGNAVATLVVARWTGDLDMDQLHARLDSRDWQETGEPEALINAKTAHMSAQAQPGS